MTRHHRRISVWCVTNELKSSPLEAVHIALGARLVPFAGWNMPVQYASIIQEHTAVRKSVGIFDISHMGQFIVEGSGAAAWLNRMLTNNVAKLRPGQGQYTLMLNEHGGVIDDLILYRTGEDAYFLVVNAAKIDEDLAWLTSHLPQDATLRDDSPAWAGMAVQGPDAPAAFAATYPGETLPPRNGIVNMANGCIVCRTGYTGEDGFEFFAPAAEAAGHWGKLTSAGAAPCGLGARDTLRLEMCYPLNGSDLTPERTPVEAGLGFFCDIEKGPFIGSEIIARQKTEGPEVRLAAIQYTGKGAPPRAHYPVLDQDGNELGELTSGALSPSLGTGIAMAYLPASLAKPGTPLLVDVRSRQFPAKVVKKPFYKSV
ncbi:MAG: glycine cleavage system aminomethyltransferase GcvT [Luteolibacter sp.]